MINPHIFRAYDIRGIAMATEKFPNVDLTPETIKLIGKAAGSYMKRKYDTKNMVVGRDNRLHSKALQEAFIEGVLSTGVDVIDVGLSTSPLIYFAICKNNYDSGVNITASHNPKEYNGIKINGKDAHSVCGDELQSILKLIQSDDFEKGEGKYTHNNINFYIYMNELESRIQLGKRKLKVVIDCGNGVAGLFAGYMLRKLGCDVYEIFCNLDGNFPNHEANPEEEKNLRTLMVKVKAREADLGIGFDGDGDRLGIIDENGKHYSSDLHLLFVAADMLKNIPNSPVIFDVKASLVVIDELKRLGGIPTMSKVGHSFIEQKVHEMNAPLAGEVSGHMFFGKPYYDFYGFDDAFFAACKTLEILSKTDKPFSEHFKHLPVMHTTPEFKAHCPDDKKFEIVKKLVEHFTGLYDCITMDGVRINFDKTSWGAVRCSNTSPNLTLRFEAQTPEKLKEIQAIMVEQLKKYPEVNLGWYSTSDVEKN